MMKLKNTFDVPLAVFYIPAGEGDRSATVLQPGDSTDVDLKPGDMFTMRVATEITDPGPTPPENIDESETDPTPPTAEQSAERDAQKEA